MSDLELEAVSRWRRGQSQRGIARDLAISRDRVRRILERHQQDRQHGAPHAELPQPGPRRSSQLDAFIDKIQTLLERHPEITAVRVLEELREQGYEGCYSSVRDRLRELRPRPQAKPVVRFETQPGAQAQMDYAVYDIDFTAEGRRRVSLFSYVLGYSRRQYIRFTESQDFETTIREHVRAFEHLQGVAASCLYDNMKVVVQRWENEQPVYNTRFLAFATHYGFRPAACRPRRPQTKGKVERPFAYVESSLLNGREFRCLEHLNEVAQWWLANRADVRQHRTTGKRPLDAHAQELAHLLPLPEHHYDTAKVLYRLVSPEGRINYRQNQYSAPWQQAGRLLPVRVTEDRLLIYDQRLNLLADHLLWVGSVKGQLREATEHRPPRSEQVRREWLEERFAELGDVSRQFLQGLLRKQRCGWHQAQQVLLLQRHYRRQDLLAALQRAVRYHAYSLAAVERILAAYAVPQPAWKHLSEDQQELLKQLADEPPTVTRPTSDYQHLLFDVTESEHASQEQEDERSGGEPLDPPADPGALGDAEDSADE